MADVLIIGVISDCDPKRVESLAAATQISHDRLKLLTAQVMSDDEDCPISFIRVAEMTNNASLADAMTRRTGVLPNFGGTTVPGLAALESLDAFSHARVHEYLRDSAVPAGAAEAYNDALADGRCVIMYTCSSENAARVQTAFEAAGVRDVRGYVIP
jgi:hypothetical protein